MENQVRVGGERSAVRAELGAALQESAAELAQRWRTAVFQGDPELASEKPALLEGVAEPLLVEVGRQLSSRGGPVTAPWSRCPGLLRLSVGRGRTALDEEFQHLAQVASEFAAECGATPFARRRLHSMLRAANLLARAELDKVEDPTTLEPAAPFGGVIVEIYEPPTRH